MCWRTGKSNGRGNLRSASGRLKYIFYLCGRGIFYFLGTCITWYILSNQLACMEHGNPNFAYSEIFTGQEQMTVVSTETLRIFTLCEEVLSPFLNILCPNTHSVFLCSNLEGTENGCFPADSWSCSVQDE